MTRNSYGRKCYRKKLEIVQIALPVTAKGGIDAAFADTLLKAAYDRVRNATERSVGTFLAKRA